MNSFLRGPSATAVLFLVSGLSFGSFLVRAPALKVQHGLDDVAFGILNAAFGLVAILAMRAVAPLVLRVGAVRLARGAVIALPAAVAVAGAAPTAGGYVAAVLVLAAANGVLDVAMNAAAVEAEQRAGRPILSGCHAAWSVGTVIATLAGTASIAGGTPTWLHLAAVAAVAAPVAVLAGVAIRPRSPAPVSADAPVPSSAWTPAILRLALIGTVLMVAEGAALGWSGVLLHEVRGTTLGVAAAATTAFTVGQLLARLTGDLARARWGDGALFRLGAMVAASGLAVAVLVPDAAIDIAGFGLFGIGSAILLPIVYAETGRRDPTGRAVPRITAFGYAGVLCGPGAIGVAAGAVGLAAAMAAVPPLIVLTAVAFPRRSSPAEAPSVESAVSRSYSKS